MYHFLFLSVPACSPLFPQKVLYCHSYFILAQADLELLYSLDRPKSCSDSPVLAPLSCAGVTGVNLSAQLPSVLQSDTLASVSESSNYFLPFRWHTKILQLRSSAYRSGLTFSLLFSRALEASQGRNFRLLILPTVSGRVNPWVFICLLVLSQEFCLGNGVAFSELGLSSHSVKIIKTVLLHRFAHRQSLIETLLPGNSRLLVFVNMQKFTFRFYACHLILLWRILSPFYAREKLKGGGVGYKQCSVTT